MDQSDKHGKKGPLAAQPPMDVLDDLSRELKTLSGVELEDAPRKSSLPPPVGSSPPPVSSLLRPMPPGPPPLPPGPPPLPGPREPAARMARPAAARSQDAETPSRKQRITLGMALGLAALGAALPATLLVWLMSALLATGVTAEVLELTHGFQPTTFGGGYWLAVVVDALVVVFSLGRRALGRSLPWRPLVVLVLAYTLLLWTLIPLDWAGIWDVPDVVTAFVLLGANALVSYVLPFVLLSVLGRGLRHLWRMGLGSKALARRIAALAFCLGLAGATLGGALVTGRAEGYFDELEPTSKDMGSLGIGSVEQTRQSMEALSAELRPPEL